MPLFRWLPFLKVALGRTAGIIQHWCRGKSGKRPESGLTPLLLPAGPQARRFPVWMSVLIRKMEAHWVLLLPTPQAAVRNRGGGRARVLRPVTWGGAHGGCCHGSPQSTVPRGGSASTLTEPPRPASSSRGCAQDPPCSFLPVAASVCRIRLEGTSLAEIHPQKPLPVQVLVRGELLAFRIHDVCPHHAQHTLLGHAGKNGDSRGGHVWAFCAAPCPQF